MTLANLNDAFDELERRADAAGDLIGSQGPGGPRRRPVRPGATAVAVAATVVAVATAAVGIDFASSGGSHHVAVAGNSPSQSIAASVQPVIARSTAALTSAPAAALSSKAAGPTATDVPKDQAALIARFRSILGDTATFTVDSAHSTDRLITGVLTSTSGSRGLYVLELDQDVTVCGESGQVGQVATALPCPGVTKLADGSKLKVDDNFPDGPPDGVMNDAILSRPDGWLISLYTANVQGKYYGAPVLGPKPALTTEQVTAVVRSPEWLTK